MAAISIIFRHLIVASLLASLSATGLPFCLLDAVSCRSAGPQHGAKSCCCMGNCGTHCHMACCQSPAPAQDRAPAPTRPSDDGAVTWGLAAGAAAHLDAVTAGDFRRGISQLGAAIIAPDSLLELSIRLNV